MQKRKVRAIALLSGGLDSILAAKTILEQGIEVVGLSFITPFFGPKNAQKAATKLGIPLIAKDITDEHFLIVKNPPHGYGKTMNPCIDCHALMLKAAGKLMQDEGYDFIFTGEVLGERPMSQNQIALGIVAKTSGYERYILRPLSAKLLPPTEPELKGLVDRDKLLDIQGRSRKIQIKLAKEFGIKEYPNPAGGCLLTDIGFSKRLKDLLTYNQTPSGTDLRLLKIGRHFRLSDTVKLIVGRNEAENELLEHFYMPSDFLLQMQDIPGPTGLLAGDKASAVLEIAACICASYSDAEEGDECYVSLPNNKQAEAIKVCSNHRYRKENRIN